MFFSIAKLNGRCCLLFYMAAMFMPICAEGHKHSSFKNLGDKLLRITDE